MGSIRSDRGRHITRWGVVLFAVCYALAAWWYPGGSNADRAAVGFDWWKNYWCDLLGAYAKNGQPNGGRTIALSGMLVLCMAVSVFWWRLRNWLEEWRTSAAWTGVFGAVSMGIVLFLATGYHDATVAAASFFGLLAIGNVLRLLDRAGHAAWYWWGILNVISIVVNLGMYTTGWGIGALPFAQKLTFVSYLAWVVVLSDRWIPVSRK